MFDLLDTAPIFDERLMSVELIIIVGIFLGCVCVWQYLK